MNLRACWLLLLFLPLWCQAGTLPFLYMPSNAAAAGMGGAALTPDAPGAALGGDAWPAAGMLSDVSRAVSAHYLAWNGTSDGDALLGASGFVRIGRCGIHVSFTDFLQQKLMEYDATGAPAGMFRPADRACSLGASYHISDGWAVSVTARYITTALASTAKDAVPGFDAGVAYAVQHVRAGLSVRHAGPPVNYGGEDCKQPAQIAGGAGVQYGAWSAAAEGICIIEAGQLARLGVQYAWGEVLRLRAGCQLSDAASTLPGYATAGLGFCWRTLRLDAAYLFASSQLEPSLQVGLAWATSR